METADLGPDYVFLGILSITIILFTLYYVIRVWILITTHQMKYGLPWLKWMNLEDVIALGFHAFPASAGLEVLYRNKYIQVRKKAGLNKRDDEWCDLRGFSARTISFYEFRLVKKPRRRFQWFGKFVRNLFGGWQPAGSPA